MGQIPVSSELTERVKQLGLVVLREPFRRRTWAELGYFLAGSVLAYASAAVVGALTVLGLLTTALLVGLVVLGWGLRAARELARWQRALAWHVLGDEVGEPEPVSPRPGHFGRLRATLRDRAGWLALVYFVGRLPLTLFGVWFSISVWLSALTGILSPLFGLHGFVSFGVLGHATRVQPALGQVGGPGFATRLGVLVTGVLLLFVAPWTTRLVVFVDRRMLHLLLGPDAATSRVRSLEQSRSKTLDAATVTLQRIERNLHDGTQAQLVAVAMRLGQAKEKLAHLDLDRDDAAGLGPEELQAVRRLVDEAHRGAKEAITDLRDLARGIHPPALDTGLANALSTLAARSPVPTEVSVSVPERPSPAIEAICYFSAAELLANVHQHAQASRASLSCTQHGPWVRLVVRDDGRGGAAVNRVGSTSSGLAGLADRVRAVDGELSLASPPGGPTVVTIDLPVRA